VRRLIKWLSLMVVLAAAGWSLWWYAGARGQETGVALWLDGQRERGWLAEAGAIAVDGYPVDFALRAERLALADPRAGWAWNAPVLKAVSRAYQPTRIAVTWPGEQSVGVPGDLARIRTARMETVLDLRPGPAMELRQASTEIAALDITARSGWNAGAEALVFDLSERSIEFGPPNSYDLRLEADRLVLPRHIVERIDPTGWLKPRIDRMTVRAHGVLGEALGRATVESGWIALRAATIAEASFEWGEMRLVLRGAFEVDDDGYPVGKLEIEARQWRQMVRLAVRAGLIDRETARAVTSAVEFVTALADSGDDLIAPLRLSGGKIRLGPFAIADAPLMAPPRY